MKILRVWSVILMVFGALCPIVFYASYLIPAEAIKYTVIALVMAIAFLAGLILDIWHYQFTKRRRSDG